MGGDMGRRRGAGQRGVHARPSNAAHTAQAWVAPCKSARSMVGASQTGSSLATSRALPVGTCRCCRPPPPPRHRPPPASSANLRGQDAMQPEMQTVDHGSSPSWLQPTAAQYRPLQRRGSAQPCSPSPPCPLRRRHAPVYSTGCHAAMLSCAAQQPGVSLTSEPHGFKSLLRSWLPLLLPPAAAGYSLAAARGARGLPGGARPAAAPLSSWCPQSCRG